MIGEKMTREFKIQYVNHKISNLLFIPVFFIIFFLVEKLSNISNSFIQFVCDNVAALLIVLICNYVSNIFFEQIGTIKFSETNMIVRLDDNVYDIDLNNIKEVRMSYDTPKGLQFMGKTIYLFIKTYDKKKVKIVSIRYFNKEDLKEQALSKAFFCIKELNPTLHFEESFGGTFFTLDNKETSETK